MVFMNFASALLCCGVTSFLLGVHAGRSVNTLVSVDLNHSLLAIQVSKQPEQYLPVVLWHGKSWSIKLTGTQ